MLKINNVYIAIYIYSNKTTQIIYTFIFTNNYIII